MWTLRVFATRYKPGRPPAGSLLGACVPQALANLSWHSPHSAPVHDGLHISFMLISRSRGGPSRATTEDLCKVSSWIDGWVVVFSLCCVHACQCAMVLWAGGAGYYRGVPMRGTSSSLWMQPPGCPISIKNAAAHDRKIAFLRLASCVITIHSLLA
jgi:hypothetical protein